MTDVFARLSPIILMFVLGILLRVTRVAGPNDGSLMLKIVFYVALPAMILLTIPDVEITRDLVVLPVIAGIIVVVTGLVAALVLRPVVRDRAVLGVAIVGTMIMNTSFLYPFFLVMYGNAGFARAAVFGAGNGFFVFTLVYYLACRFGENEQNSNGVLRRLLAAPPLWALVVGLVLNVTGVSIQPHLRAFVTSAGNLMVPLVMLALGIYFTPRLIRWRLLLSVLVLRSGFGLILGLLLARLFDLDGLSRAIVVVCAAAPVGFNTLVFASMTDLDVDFAAGLLSPSILLGIIYVPILMTVLG